MLRFLLSIAAITFCASAVLAQNEMSDSIPFLSGELPDVEPLARAFTTAEEHYRYLHEAADGGTRHTIDTIPQWNGLWTIGSNSAGELFLDGAVFLGIAPGGTVREGVLTPPYEEHFRDRRAQMDNFGEQQFDRLANCEYPGAARWLMEPYVKEFVNLPHQSWMMNDFMNENRRVFIGQEHVNLDGQHSATGDSIGFWNDDELVIWTKWLNPADMFRGMPLTSNQMEII